jgi:hypothetical protein
MLNMVTMELAVNATKNRLESVHEEHKTKIRHSIKVNYFRQLEAVIKTIGTKNDKSEKQKIEADFERELQESFDEHHERMVQLVEEMPETVEVYSIHQDHKQSEVETMSIPVARMAEYYVKTQYASPSEDGFDSLVEALKRSVYTSQDIINLAHFNFENLKDGNSELTQEEIIKECVTKLNREKVLAEDKIEKYETLIGGQFDKIFVPLHIMRIEESASEFTTSLRTYQSKKVITSIGDVFEQAGLLAQKLVIRLFYSRSEGILLAKRLNKGEHASSINSKLLDLADQVNPKKDVLTSLPPYYITLYNGKSSIGKDFWINRNQEESLFKKAYKRYQTGFAGGILVLGERNSGKTAFARYMSQQFGKTLSVFSVFSPMGGTNTIEGFNNAISKATKLHGHTDEILARIPSGSILIINDLELFWERSENGMKVIHELERLLDAFANRILFVVNLNPHAYKLINEMTSLGDHFIEVINMLPFDAEELKDLVLKRHQSSGLPFGYDRDQSQLSEVKIAGLFNAYFDYSDGNPGTALNGWLAHIKKASSKGLQIQKPDDLTLSVFKTLNEDWTMLLIQFVLHKRLTKEKISRITSWSDSEVETILLAMLRSGIVAEKAIGVYHIAPYVLPFMIEAFKEREILA